MLLYERFSVPDQADTAGPISTKDVATGRNLVLFRTAVPSTVMAARLGEASSIFELWAVRHHAARESTELFTSPGAMWLTAPSEPEIAELLAELRAHGLFEKPRLQAEPPPHPSPPPPPLPAKRCAGCGKAPLKGKLHCAACAPNAKAPPRPRSRRRLLGWALVALLAGTLSLWWWATHGNDEPKPRAAPIVQFTASRTRVKRGSTVVLKWQTSGLGSLSIAPGIGPVGASGSRTVVVNQDTTFTLRSADQGSPPPASVTVTIVRSGAPTAAVALSPATAGQKAEVEGALRVWEISVSTNDPQAEAALYAPHLDRYFLQQNVDNRYVQSYLTNYFATTAQFSNFSFSDPIIGFDEDGTARVSLLKHYTLTKPTGETRRVTTRSELHLRLIYGQWKITFERDFKD